MEVFMLWMYRYDFHQAKKRCSNENDGDSFGESLGKSKKKPDGAEKSWLQNLGVENLGDGFKIFIFVL